MGCLLLASTTEELPKKPKDQDAPWFSPVAIGRNKLAQFVKDMCKEANISGDKTNHSLRATGATAMFAAGVPEKLVKGVTGHKSKKALEAYERPTVQQGQAVSKVLTAGESYAPESVAGMESSSKVGEKLSVMQVKSATQNGGNLLRTMFSGLNSCTINITPQNFVVNLQPTAQPPSDANY